MISETVNDLLDVPGRLVVVLDDYHTHKHDDIEQWLVNTVKRQAEQAGTGDHPPERGALPGHQGRFFGAGLDGECDLVDGGVCRHGCFPVGDAKWDAPS